MVIATGGPPPSLAEAEEFLRAWPAELAERLRWFTGETEGHLVLDGSTASLEPALAWVAGRLGTEGPVERVPAWYSSALAERGWTAYGVALAEGLIGYVAGIYADRLGGDLPWVLDRDPQSAYHLKPVVDVDGIAPPWRQVIGALGAVRGGAAPERLRAAVEHSLEHRRPPAPASGPWAEVSPTGPGEWQVSFPEDVAERLGQAAYAELEDRLAAVDGVREALMEDRDRAIVRTDADLAADELAGRLDAAVTRLAGSP